MKVLNKRELQEIAINNFSDIDCKSFMKIYKKYTPKPCTFVVNNSTLASNNPLHIGQNILEVIYNIY